MVDENMDTVRHQSQLWEKIITLCESNPKYIHILRNIEATDKAYKNDSFGWQFKDVEWSGGNVSRLLQEGIIRYGYKSNSATHFRLNLDVEELKVILDVVAEHQYIENEQKKTKESVTRREPIPEKVKMYVWRRDGGRCVNCHSNQKLEFDHIIPVSKGGSNTTRNIQLLCENCNRSKNAKIGLDE